MDRFFVMSLLSEAFHFVLVLENKNKNLKKTVTNSIHPIKHERQFIHSHSQERTVEYKPVFFMFCLKIIFIYFLPKNGHFQN